MVERYLHQSPLAHLRLAARASADTGQAGVFLCERNVPVQLALRGNGDGGFHMAVEAVLGVPLPDAPNRVSEAGATRVLWLGPDEWLVASEGGSEDMLVRRLLEALAGEFASVAGVSEARAVIGLAGRKARDVLSHGCSLDLHPRVFQPGACAQSLLAHVPILLHQRDEHGDLGPRYDIYVQRSLAEHLWRWLEDAAEPYGVAVIEK